MVKHKIIFYIFLGLLSFFSKAQDKLPIEISQTILSGDYKQAFPSLNKLAKAGNLQAQYQLALFYLNGLFVSKSAEKAEYWLLLSAKEHKKSSFLLADLYLKGKVLGKDFNKAKHFLQLSSSQGNRKADKKLELLAKIKTQLSSTQLQSEFLQAIKHGNLAEATRLYQLGIKLATKNNDGNTPLLMAIKYKQKKLALWLFDVAKKQSVETSKLLNVDTKNNSGNSALHLSVTQATDEITNLLIRFKAKINSQNNLKQTPLMLAISLNHRDIAQYLINENASLTIKDDHGNTAIEYIKSVDMKLALPSNNNNDQSSLITNATINRAITALTIQAKDKESPYFQWPILSIAVAQNQPTLINYLLKNGHNPWASSIDNRNAIYVALTLNETDLALRLLTYNKNDFPSNKLVIALFDQAIEQSNLRFINKLIEQGSVSIFDKLPLTKTPLWTAIKNNKYDVFMTLVQHFPVDNRRDDKQRTYLLLAAEKNLTPIVQQLISMDVDNSVQNDKGRNALWYAAEHSNNKLIETLLLSDSSIDQSDKSGYTALMRAVLKNCYECVVSLLNHGADYDKLNVSVNSALMFAAQGKAKILNLILQRNVDIAARNNDSFTALMLAVQHPCFKCVELLLNAGANPKRKNKNGDNSFDLAKDNTDILAILNQ